MKYLRTVLLFALVSLRVSAQDMVDPLTPGGSYDPAVPSPATLLGFTPGDRPASCDQVLAYARRLAETSQRVRVMPMGETYEHRSQLYLIFTSPENMARLDQIKAGIDRLADPRTLDEAQMRSLTAQSPAVVWIGYGIHGNELSSVDAALHVAYQLAAGTDTATLAILKNLVVCIDPMENPDGRERFLGQMEEWNAAAPNPDAQSLHHTGLWPYGRGNHYLFDLNRDWFPLVHPETRARVKAVLSWHPQLFIDSHEMGGYDTYLFSPPRQPINPNISAHSRRWWSILSADQARAFDRHGWSYYTREWNDDWYPGYANSWAMYTDAAGMLYEQARVEGTLVKRPDGTTLRYRETVHHHVVSSLANLSTAARHRQEFLTEYYASRREAMTPPAGQAQAFYLLPGTNPGRVEHLVDVLLQQRIEVHMADKEFTVPNAHAPMETQPKDRVLPKGTYIVQMDQPMSRLARAILEFDPHMLTSVIQEERKELEKKNDTSFYDITGWSLPIAYGIDAYWSETRATVQRTPVTSIVLHHGTVSGSAQPVGYLIAPDDRGMEALAYFFTRGCHVRAAQEPFSIEGRQYPRGTLLLRSNNNPVDLAEIVKTAAESLGVDVHAVGTGLSTTGPDLGGNDFVLLREPRILIVGGPEVSTNAFGDIWHLLEQRLHYPVSLVQMSSLASVDLRRYNTLVLPSTGDAQTVTRGLGKTGISKLLGWIEGGGTLIATGNAAAFCADTSSGISAVRLRHQVLKDLELYATSLGMEQKSRQCRHRQCGFLGRKDSCRRYCANGQVPPAAGKELAEKELALLMNADGSSCPGAASSA